MTKNPKLGYGRQRGRLLSCKCHAHFILIVKRIDHFKEQTKMNQNYGRSFFAAALKIGDRKHVDNFERVSDSNFYSSLSVCQLSVR